MDIALLEEVILFTKGKKPSLIEDIGGGDKKPYILIENFDGNYSFFTSDVNIPTCNKTDTLIVCDGARTGLCATGLEGYIGSTLAAISSKNHDILLPKYLFYYLKSKSKRVREMARGAAIPHLDKGFFLKQKINLPNIETQNKSIEMLSSIENIIALRKKSLLLIDELIPSIFYEMFGDVVSNSMGWPLEKFGQVGVLDRGKSKYRPRDAAELYGGNYPFIQTGDVANSNGEICSYRNTYSELGLAQSKLWDVGTLCITIAANIAKTAILRIPACFPDSVVGFIADSNKVNVQYTQTWLSFLQPILEANAPQAAQKNINLQILRNLQIPVPPLEPQNLYCHKVQLIMELRKKQNTALIKLKEIHASLLNECYPI